MTEKDIRIQSPELAEVMAYAEVPFMDMAARAIGYSQRERYGPNLIDAANEASAAAGREYLAQLSVNLGLHEMTIPEVFPTTPEALSEPWVEATKQNMLKFVSQDEDPKEKQTMVARIWTIFGLLQRDLEGRYQNHMVWESPEYHSGLRKIYLTQSLIDESIELRNMGPKLHSLLQSYFDARIGESLKDQSTPE